MYRHLPKELTIKKSKIHGQGVFATEKIQIGSELGITHHIIHPDSEFECDIVRTPLGGFINHSETPNCFIQEQGLIYVLYVIKPIKANEELTVYYTLYDV